MATKPDSFLRHLLAAVQSISESNLAKDRRGLAKRFKIRKDGVDTIEVYATRMCPMPSKSKIQSKLTVIGTVAVRNDQPALTAKELRFE